MSRSKRFHLSLFDSFFGLVGSDLNETDPPRVEHEVTRPSPAFWPPQMESNKKRIVCARLDDGASQLSHG